MVTFANLMPWSVWDCYWLAPMALVLDLLLGDPRLPWPHPVCAIGRALDWLEPFCRMFMQNGETEDRRRLRGRVAGLLALVLVAICVWLFVGSCLHLPFVAPVFALYFAWSGLAMGCLLRTGREVLWRIENCDISADRKSVV